MKYFVKYFAIGGGAAVLGLIVGLITFGVSGPGREVQLINEEDTKKNEEPVLREETKSPFVAGTYTGSPLITKVIDGNTIETKQGIIKLIGIEAPETTHPSKPVECMGKEATNKLKELVEGKTVRLEKDVSETSKQGQLLRYVYLEDETFVNDVLVREGFARAIGRQPDQKYQNQLAAAQLSAKENKWGLWSGLCQ